MKVLNLKLTNPFGSVIGLQSQAIERTTKFSTGLQSNNACETYNFKPFRVFSIDEMVMVSFREKHSMVNNKISKLLTPISKESI